MSCIDLYLIEIVVLYSLRKHKWIDSQLQSNVFDDVRNKLVSAHCTVTSNVLTVTKENHKRCIFPITVSFT